LLSNISLFSVAKTRLADSRGDKRSSSMAGTGDGWEEGKREQINEEGKEEGRKAPGMRLAVKAGEQLACMTTSFPHLLQQLEIHRHSMRRPFTTHHSSLDLPLMLTKGILLTLQLLDLESEGLHLTIAHTVELVRMLLAPKVGILSHMVIDHIQVLCDVCDQARYNWVYDE